MSGFPLLTAILLIPICGILVMACLPREANKTIKLVAATAMSIALLLSAYAYWAYDFSLGGMQYTENIAWIPDLGVNYALGVDGISLPLLFLTMLVGVAAVFVSWNLDKRPKEFFILLLILLTGVAGTFITRDLFIFLLFYELVVIPIYIMVIITRKTTKICTTLIDNIFIKVEFVLHHEMDLFVDFDFYNHNQHQLM